MRNSENSNRRTIKIAKVSKLSSIITIILAIIFITIINASVKQFKILQKSTSDYLVCQEAAKQLQNGSDYLTSQIELFATTGDISYMDNYFIEAKETRRRDLSLETLTKYFSDSDITFSLQTALKESMLLMQTEYYSMRLTVEGYGLSLEECPEEVRSVQLSKKDQKLTSEEKKDKAQVLVSDRDYRQARINITSNVNECMTGLINVTRDRQDEAISLFIDMFLKLNIGLIILVLLIISISNMIQKLVVKPLLKYNDCITLGETLPVIGADELQSLAKTYNHMFLENQETQKLIRHEAEHDALTNVLNRGSFEKLLKIYEKGKSAYGMIIVDIDHFKDINDNYGHAVGDEVLKVVAAALSKAFRNVDYVCRIGGDEFAVIIIDSNSSHGDVIHQKFVTIREQLSNLSGKIPPVTLSVGVAFSDRPNPGSSIYEDTDIALYYVKNHGRNNCAIYGDF